MIEVDGPLQPLDQLKELSGAQTEVANRAEEVRHMLRCKWFVAITDASATKATKTAEQQCNLFSRGGGG